MRTALVQHVEKELERVRAVRERRPRCLRGREERKQVRWRHPVDAEMRRVPNVGRGDGCQTEEMQDHDDIPKRDCFFDELK